MSKSIVLDDPWPRITAACKRSRADVAVAYVGGGAPTLLPLRPGSRLVADASELAVRTGQTDPRVLLKYFRDGVHVFSQPWLHAKVFAFSKVAFVGSNNVSNRSAHTLFEAAVVLTGRGVAQARRYVSSVAKSPLGAKYLKKLMKIYRPPRIPRGTLRPRRTFFAPGATPLRVVQLVPVTWGEEENAADAAGRNAARTKKSRGFDLNSFSYKPGWKHDFDEEVLQVLTKEDGQVVLSPPGRVLEVRKVRGKRKSIIVLEVPPRYRRTLSALRKRLPRETLKRLQGSGALAPRHAALIRDLWSVNG